MVSIQLFISNDTSTGTIVDSPAASFKFDMANLLPERSMEFTLPPEIQKVGDTALYVAYGAIGVCVLVQIFLLANTLQHKNDSIMKLSQVWYLVSLQVASIFATLSCVFLEPRSDLFCRLQSPMTMIPLQFMLAIILGRLHRIIVIMAPLLAWREEKTKNVLSIDLSRWSHTFMSSVMPVIQPLGTLAGNVREHMGRAVPFKAEVKSVRQKIAQALCCAFQKTQDSGLRQAYTVRQLNILIFFVVLPVILVEVFGYLFFDPLVTLHMHDDGSVGTLINFMEFTATFIKLERS
jgi:hypothetical protein